MPKIIAKPKTVAAKAVKPKAVAKVSKPKAKQAK